MAFDYDKAHRKLVSDLEEQSWGVATVYLQYDPEQLAHWILKEYRPPIEWEEEPDVLDSQLLTFRTFVAGRVFEETTRITAEMLRQKSPHIPEVKKRLRWAIGRRLMDFLERINDPSN